MSGAFEGPKTAESRQPVRRLKDVLIEGLELCDLLTLEDRSKIEKAAYAACTDPSGPNFCFELAEAWQARSFVTNASGTLERAHFRSPTGEHVALVLEGTPFYRDTVKAVASALGYPDGRA